MSNALTGRKVLVVEDESLVAMLLETILEDMGCIPVGPVSTVDEGVQKAENEPDLDLALLDVNVAGRQVFPVAEALARRGIPMVFSTGYGEAGLRRNGVACRPSRSPSARPPCATPCWAPSTSPAPEVLQDSRAALCPGAPVTPPPGCAPDPHR
ncbi:response regulator [Brevundimonas denitrificans]|uniref:response regulator n=1 Tax=Brevundimonas denitrificans TaxID=1443434 RepID=UPI00352F3C24